LLIAAREGAAAPIDATHDILEMHYRGIAILPVRNLAPDGKPCAGEELGIEWMLGLYWTLDDVDASKREIEQATTNLKAECSRVLEAFYTNPPSA
jgi:hypothetical protein